MKYGEVVQDLAARGQNWHFYYKNLRQSQPSSFPWGATHWELWLRSQFHQAKISQSSGQAQSKSVKENWPAVPKGYCFKYHRGMACSGCQFKHSCFKCDGVHRATQCNFRRPDSVSKERPEAAKSYRKPQSDKSRITSAQPPIPVRIERLQFLLDGYSPSTVCYLVSGFLQGFPLHYQGTRVSSKAKKLISALQNPEAVDTKLRKELEANRLSGPYRYLPFPIFRVSPLGVVPKKTPGEFRLIHHLSFPKGFSVNDGIPTEHTSVSYASIGDAIRLTKLAGPGCFFWQRPTLRMLLGSYQSIQLITIYLVCAGMVYTIMTVVCPWAVRVHAEHSALQWNGLHTTS